MKRFVSKMVNMMREEMLFSWQGGPIILLQVGKIRFWSLYMSIDFIFHSPDNEKIGDENCLYIIVLTHCICVSVGSQILDKPLQVYHRRKNGLNN